MAMTAWATEGLTLRADREDHHIAALAALAITIQVAEAALPSPVPGVKPGLANVITLYVLFTAGWRAAVQVAVLRVLGASLLLGTFGSPAFVLSLSGALAAVASMGLTHRLPATGPVGVSAVAGMAHMGAQFLVAWTWLLPVPGLVHLLPVLLSFALGFGILSGMIAMSLMERTGEVETP